MKEVQVSAQEYGIAEKEEKQLMGNLPSILLERETFADQCEEVFKADIEDPKTWEQAKYLRIRIQKNRTQGINVWHRNAKDYFLKGGQFVDAIRRKEIAVNERLEENLKEIEKYEEIQKQKRIDKLNKKREKQFEGLEEYLPRFVSLGELEEDEFNNLLNGAKLQHEAKMEAIRKEEAERKERERIEKLRNERSTELQPYYDFVIIPEGDDLGAIDEKEYSKIKADAVKKKEDHIKEQEEIRKEKERLEAEAKRLEALRIKEKKAAAEKARKEKEKLEAQMKKEKEAAEKKLAAELEARKKAEKEFWEAQKKIKAAQEKKAKEEKARKEAERQRKLAPDKDKLLNLSVQIDILEFPDMKTEEGKSVLKNVEKLLEKVSTYIKNKTKEL